MSQHKPGGTEILARFNRFDRSSMAIFNARSLSVVLYARGVVLVFWFVFMFSSVGNADDIKGTRNYVEDPGYFETEDSVIIEGR